MYTGRRPVFCFLALLALLSGARRAVAGSPNVVLVIADDQTWTDSGAYGNKDVRTPNIDRLAREGMRFTRAFTATAMCAPTRQQLYTGIFPVKNGAFPNHSKVKPGTKSLVHHFRGLGYRVGLVGKRHFGPPASFPFETVARRDVSAFLKRKSDQPFFLVVASKSPHLPWTAGDASAYDPAKLKLPPDFVDTSETREALTRYYAEITDFDREVGECLAQVDASGQAMDTVFIYTSEQGAQFPRRKWTCYEMGLHVAFIVRWPARVKPGSVAHAMVQYVDVVPTLIEAAGGKPIDGLDGRSFLGVLLGKTDRHADAVFGVHTTRGIIHGSPCYPVRSVRTETYQYIRNLKSEELFRNITTAGGASGGYWSSWVERAKTDPHAKRWVNAYQRRPAEELYDLRSDPFELTNLAADPKLAKVRDELSRKLDEWMRSQGDLGVETELGGSKHRKKKGK